MSLAAAIPLLASTVLIEALRRRSRFHRLRRLNRAVHELRRPMQSLELAVAGRPPDLRAARACLEQASFALAELDGAVNGSPPDDSAPATTRLVEVTRGLEDRWGPAGVRVLPPARDLPVRLDPRRLGAAIDNLVANALRHGSGRIEVRAVDAGGVARIEVSDGGPSPRAPGAGRDPRHGHGLRVVGDAARASGATLTGPAAVEGGRTLAALTFPPAGPEPGG